MNSDRTTLKLVSESDFPDFLDMFHEPDTFKYINPLDNKTDTEYLAYLKLKLDEIKSGRGYYWAVRTKEANEFIGAINLTPIPNTDQIQIGWQIKNKFRQQGYAYESAKKVFDFALAETDFNPIYAVFVKANVASEKILLKLNFEYLKSFTKNDEKLEKYIYRIDK